jgi:hypothetical protein
MRLAGYQPQYFPRLHYFNRILTSDVFEVSDYVQFVAKHAFPQSDGSLKRGKSYQAHTPIKLDQGMFLLAIPVHDALLPINKTEIVYSRDFPAKHLKSIEVGYRKSENFSKFFPEIEQLLTQKYDNLADLTIRSTLWGIIRFVSDDKLSPDDISVQSTNKILIKKSNPFKLKKVFLASESPVAPPARGEANDWIIKLCKYANAIEYYYGGTSHAAYMDNEKLIKNGITPVLQDWKCAEYRQQYAKAGFIPNLSCLDLIMNEDLATRIKIIS